MPDTHCEDGGIYYDADITGNPDRFVKFIAQMVKDGDWEYGDGDSMTDDMIALLVSLDEGKIIVKRARYAMVDGNQGDTVPKATVDAWLTSIGNAYK